MPRILIISMLIALAADARGDWPMLAHDAARSGATAEEIRPPFSRKWYRLFADEGLQTGVQPVVTGNRLYIGTLRGRLHAIDTQTGNDAWAYDAGSPILHAAAADADRVYFGTARGGIVAVNSKEGTRAWDVAIAQGVWNAPLLHEGVLIAGGRDGKLYAIGAAEGALKWTARLDGPVLNSPAVDARLGRVYVGCEDMRVYAFDLVSGKELWRSSKLPGVSFRGYHPVIAPDGSIMVTVTPCAGGDAMQQVLLDMVKEVFGNFSSWRIKSEEEKKRIRAENFELMKRPETYPKQMEYLRKRLTNDPALQTFFVLDPATGKPKFVTPIVYAESMNGPCSPPLVTPAGKVIVKYNALLRSRYEHYSPFLNVGYLDTTIGDITPIMDQSRTYGWYDSLLLVHDEQSQLCLAGKMLINTHQDNVNAMDLDTLKGYPTPWAFGVHEVKPGVAASIWASILHDKPLPVGWEWLARGSAVYGGGSAIDVPVVVSGDSFYFLPTHEINAGVALVAYRMDKTGQGDAKGAEPSEKMTEADWPTIREMKWDWDMLQMPRLNLTLTGLPAKMPGTRLAPLEEQAKARVEKVPDSRLDALILQELEPKPGMPSARLDSAVEELIGTTWRPLLFPAGKAPAESYRIFTDPSETLYTLALAYPHLAPALQAKARAHVARMMRDAGPLGRRTYEANVGEIRSAYDEAPPSLLKMGTDVARSETARVYPLYLWARASGQMEDLKSQWPQIKPLLDPKPEKNEPDLGNGRLSGLIAACRIAHQVNDPDRDALLKQTRDALRDRLRYEFAHTEGGVMTVSGQRTLLGRWHHLNPDLAQILAEFCAPIHHRLMDVYVDHHRPAWYIAWNVELLWRNESPFSFPSMSSEIFAARALILNEPTEQLEKFVDLSWCKADEYYIQKLALLERARQQRPQ